MNDDTISRQAAIDVAMNDSLIINAMDSVKDGDIRRTKRAITRLLKSLPSAQPEQTKMIKEIREWINSGNRGSADYFIVDKIEEIINKYE